MFVYKNHRIHIAGFSYEIPENEYGICVLEIVIEARKGRALEAVMASEAVTQFLTELGGDTV